MSESTVRVPIDSSSSSGGESPKPRNTGSGTVPKAPSPVDNGKAVEPKNSVPLAGLPGKAPPKAPTLQTEPKTSVKAKPKGHRKKKDTEKPSAQRDHERDSRRGRHSERRSHREREISSHRARDREGRRRSKSRSRRRYDHRHGYSNPTTPRPLLRRTSGGIHASTPAPVPMEMEGPSNMTPRATLMTADERFQLDALTSEINSAISMRQDFIGASDREVKRAAQILAGNGIFTLQDLRMTPKRL